MRPIALFLLFHFILVGAVMEDVVIIEQPQSGHVVKSRPYRLTCRALNAKNIRFKCNNRWVDEARYETELGTDPSSQLPYMERSVDITRQEVDSSVHIEEISCQCYASDSSESHAVRSEPARIRLSYMRKHFLQTPTSQRVAEGSTVLLPCVAPDAEPKATITWWKDGVELFRQSDSNLIYANDGSLIISAARLLDSGNYSCEANNLAAKRITDPAPVNVYVNGGWSEWTAWSGVCLTDCDLLRRQISVGGEDALPRRRRTRLCNNPPPLNGGSYCEGGDEEQRVCDIACRVDGRWSNWSSWSDCGSTCQRVRSRTCMQPMNGGSPCQGPEMESLTCGDGACQPIASTTDLALLGGVGCVALLLMIIIGLCAALLCRRAKNDKTSGGSIYYAEGGGHVRRVLLNQRNGYLDGEECQKVAQLGSQFFTLASTCSPSPLHPTLQSGKSVYSGYSAARNVGSRAALITECSSSNSSSGGKQTLVRSSSNCSEDENYATLYDFPEEGTVTDTSQAVIATQVDQMGARLQLRRSGATLLIPENAVASDRMIYLAVSDQLADRPVVQPGETVLSAVVIVGECDSGCGSALQRPIIVSFRHCASVFPKDNWTFILYADEGFGWNPVVTVGEENINTTMYVYVESAGRRRDGLGWCHVMMDSFARLALVGKARRPSVQPCKTVHLAAYGPSQRPSGPFELRVYCVPETGASMVSVERQEDNGRLLAESELFLLNESGDLCFDVQDVTPGFSICGSQIVEIGSNQHRWCSQNGLHCSLNVICSEKTPVEEFSARVSVYQKNNPAEDHNLIVKFSNSIYDKPVYEEDKVVTTDFHLPIEVKQQLGLLLDPPSDINSDWRTLAKKLHFDRYLQFFGTRPGCSPTVLLLDLWEAAECGSERAVHDLLQMLRVLGQHEAVDVLELYLSQISY